MPRVHFLSQNRPGPRMGMGHYERLLIEHLMAATTREEWQFDFSCDGRVSESEIRADATMHPDFASANGLGFATVRLAGLPWPMVRAVMRKTLSRRASKGDAPDVFHSLSLSFAPGLAPAIYTIHDLAPVRFADEGELPKWAKQAVREARLIVTPSEFGKREVVELLGVEPAKVKVVPNGWEQTRFNLDVPVAGAAVLKPLGIEGPFLLSAGGASRRKNIPALLEAWKIVAPHHPELVLVLVGSQALKNLVAAHDAPRVLALGYLPHELLPSVMRAARALIFPSIYEGFGFPPQEAMAMGVPVVASRACEAAVEVMEGTGVLAEDGTPEALAQALLKLLGDPDLEAQLRAAGPGQAQKFSWPDHASQVLGFYRALCSA